MISALRRRWPRGLRDRRPPAPTARRSPMDLRFEARCKLRDVEFGRLSEILTPPWAGRPGEPPPPLPQKATPGTPTRDTRCRLNGAFGSLVFRGFPGGRTRGTP